MRGPITIQASSPSALRVASVLSAHPRLDVRITRRRPFDINPRGRVLRIEPGSRLDPVLSLLWGEHQLHDEEAQRREAWLGLSAGMLDGGPPGYEWSGSSRPLSFRTCMGRPDSSRPWVLVAPHVRLDLAAITALTGLADPQLHYLKPRAAALGGVCWLPTRTVLLSLLGRVHAVVASQGPLAWDAARLRAPVLEPEPVRALPKDGVERRLASMVPSKLVQDEGFWRTIGDQLADGVDPARWGTTAWTLRSQECDAAGTSARSFGPADWRKKWLKLRRDPARFWADSSVARRLVRQAF